MESRLGKLVVEPWDVDNRLAALGLTRSILVEAVRAGELERVSCTGLDPLSYPGIAAWALAVRRLREQLIPLGWKLQNKYNLPLVVNPASRIAIGVTSGSPGTGESDAEPSTKHPKGPIMAGQVEVNQRQLVLGFTDLPRLLPMPPKNEVLTWLLLVYAEFHPRTEDTGTHIAKCELSVPAEIDEEGYVCRWDERIILDPVRIDEVRRPSRDDEEDEGFDVPVARR